MADQAICIVGMHRSGTSMASRGVNLLGAWLGDQAALMGPAHDNLTGFWERWDLMEFHDRVLDFFGASWHDPSPMPPNWNTKPQAKIFLDELESLIEKAFGGHSLWAFKDPRVCMLLPLWKKALARRGTTLQIILVGRNPLDVAQSLARRNEFSRKKSFGLWGAYYEMALKEGKDFPLIVTHFDRLIQEPVEQFKRIAKALDLPFTDKAMNAIQEHVCPEFRHHDSGYIGLQQIEGHLSMMALYNRLEEASRLPSFADHIKWPDQS